MTIDTKKRSTRAKTAIAGKFKRAVTYVRVSTEDQVAGTSLDDQDRQCTALLEQEGIEFVQGFRDEGASAKTADRARLMEALDFALDKRNRIDVFLVWKVDRLARNTEDHFAIRRLLRSGGVDLRSATEPIGDDPSSKLFEVMVAGFAEFDNSIRRVRCVNGMRARIRNGIWPFRAPPGYRNRSLTRRDLKKTDPDPIDPVVFPILQAALKGYARGAMTQSEIVKRLVDANFETLAGVKATPQLVERLLSTYVRFYGGWLRDAFGDQVEYHRGRHDPMITEEEMLAIERLRAGGPRVAIVHARVRPEFPLKGLLRCKDCDHPLTSGRSRGRHAHYSYYHCFSRAFPHRRPSFRKEEVERRFMAFLQNLTPRPEVMAALCEAITQSWADREAAHEAAARALDEKLGNLAARRAKILELAESGAYSDAVVTERLAVIERAIAETDAARPATGGPSVDPAATAREAFNIVEKVSREWMELDGAIRDRFAKIAFPGGLAYSPDEGFLNRKPSCVFAVNAALARLDSPNVDLDGFSLNRLAGELGEIVDLGLFIET